MAKYKNLKDYLQHEKIILITNSIKQNYFFSVDEASSVQNTIIHSVNIIKDDKDFNVYMKLIVSIQYCVNNNELTTKYFFVHLSGNIDKKLEDIYVGVVEESTLKAERIKAYIAKYEKLLFLNNFILDDMDDLDVNYHGEFIYENLKNEYGFDRIGLCIDKMVIGHYPVFFADLDDNTLGRVCLEKSNIEIYYYDIIEKNFKYKSHIAKPGTILVNKKKYKDGLDGGFLVTIAHEIVHYQLHYRLFKVLRLLEFVSDSIDCPSKPVLYDTNMSDIEKALCIVEHQANKIAMSLVMPESTITEAFTKALIQLSLTSQNIYDINQNIVIELAKIYHVSPFIAKKRLRQLGYNWVDGTIIEVNKHNMPPFCFSNALNANETFVILPNDYEKTLKKDKHLADLINSGRYIYLGYVVCLFDDKYVVECKTNREYPYTLTDYARCHAEECCLKFTYKSNYHEKMTDEFEKGFCLYTENDFIQNEDGTYKLSSTGKKETEQNFEIREKIKQIGYKKQIKYYMNINKEKRNDFYDEKYIKKETMNTYLVDEKSDKFRKIPLEAVLVLCNKFKLEYDLSIALIKAAGYYLDDNTKIYKVYKILLNNVYLSLEKWDAILENEGFKPLYNKDKKREISSKKTLIKI